MLHRKAQYARLAEVYYEGIGWVPTDQSFGRGRYNVKDR